MGDIAALVRDVAAHHILPLFQNLRDHHIEEKSPGDLVTQADRAAEAELMRRLDGLIPGAGFLGEEAAAVDPELIRKVDDPDPLWIIDPVDGTRNFVDGKPEFALMLAYADGLKIHMSWIYFPATGRLVMAEEGSGAELHDPSGTRVRLRCDGEQDRITRGSLNVKYLPPGWRDRVGRLAATGAALSSFLCAGSEYVAVARGEKDFVTYYRMLPWDHAPGALILREAGGVVRSLETGLDYQPPTLVGPHLLARGERSWRYLRDLTEQDGDSA